MTWVAYQISWDTITRHYLDYDPRLDVDRLLPFGLARCGRLVREDRRIDNPHPFDGADCKTCARLTGDVE